MKIKIGKSGESYRVYLPKDVGEHFGDKDVEILTDYFTVTLLRPGAELPQVEHSLELALDDIRLRLGKKKLREVLKE